jgi:hypothetical protein
MLNKTDYYTLLGRIAELEADVRSITGSDGKNTPAPAKAKTNAARWWE